MTRFRPLLLVLPLGGCLQRQPPPVIHYVVGPPYQADGVWRYPAADFGYDATGIATVSAGRHGRFTTDGERFSPEGFTAAHPTLQLPAIARVTNLENGRQIVVRIDDRGPADPGRILAVTPRVAALLEFSPAGTARVRVQVLPGPSEALALSLPGGPEVSVARAPVGAVAVSALPALPGAVAEQTGPPGATPPSPSAAPARLTPPDEQPGARSRVAPAPGRLWVRAGLFSDQRYAAIQVSALARFGATMRPRYGGGMLHVEVRIGPVSGIAEADAMLEEVLRAGIAGARIVVE